MNNYGEFLEEYLGPIQYGWAKDEQSVRLPFQVVKYSRGPFPGAEAYSTLGLSSQALASRVSAKRIHHELLFVSYSSFGDRNIPSILQRAGLAALQKQSAYLRGDLIGPYGLLFDQSRLTALYVAIPVLLPEEMHVCRIDDRISIVTVWLVPVTSGEANFITLAGWSAFEDALVAKNPDLLDFSRQSIFGGSTALE